MAVAAVEPISPELALVCPELRKRALASLPDVAWRAFVEEARVRAVPEPVEVTRWEAVRSSAASLIGMLRTPLALILCVVGMTLILTLIADATR